jgi:hypothetical protein
MKLARGGMLEIPKLNEKRKGPQLLRPFPYDGQSLASLKDPIRRGSVWVENSGPGKAQSPTLASRSLVSCPRLWLKTRTSLALS